MTVHEAWDRLRMVSALSFEAQSHAVPGTGWNGQGEGNVRVEQTAPHSMTFAESGTWTPTAGRPFPFHNIFRWNRDDERLSIRLEHLRFGVDHPVYLFDLVAAGEQTLVSSEPHICRQDLYSARMEFDQRSIRLKWSINGPAKNEQIAFEYR